MHNENLLEICSTARDVLTLANCRLMENAMLNLIDILNDSNVPQLNKSEIENPCSSYPAESKAGRELSSGHGCATCLCNTILKPFLKQMFHKVNYKVNETNRRVT